MKTFMQHRQNKQEDEVYKKQKEYENKLNQKRLLLHQEFKLKDFNDQIIDKNQDIIPVHFNEIYCKWLNVNKKQQSTLDKLQEQLWNERDKIEFEKGPDESKFSKFEPNFSITLSNQRKKDLGTTSLSLYKLKDKNYLQENIEKLETTLKEKDEQCEQEKDLTRKLREKITEITLSKKQQQEELNQIRKMNQLMNQKYAQFNEITRKAQTKAILKKKEEQKNEQQIQEIIQMEKEYMATKKQQLEVLQKQNEKQEISIAQIQVKKQDLQKKNDHLQEEINKLDLENEQKLQKEKKNYIIGQQIWLLDNIEKLFLQSDPHTEFEKQQQDVQSLNNLDLDYQINILNQNGENSRYKKMKKQKKMTQSNKRKSLTGSNQLSRSKQFSPKMNKSGFFLDVQEPEKNQTRRKSVSMNKIQETKNQKRLSKLDSQEEMLNSYVQNFSNIQAFKDNILTKNAELDDKNIKDIEFLQKNYEVHQWLLHQEAPLLNRSQILKYLEEYYHGHQNPQNLNDVCEQICQYYQDIQQQIDGQENWLEYLAQQKKSHQQELKNLEEEIAEQKKINQFLDLESDENKLKIQEAITGGNLQIELQQSNSMDQSGLKVKQNLNDSDNENFENYKEDYFLSQNVAMDAGILEIEPLKNPINQKKIVKITEEEDQKNNNINTETNGSNINHQQQDNQQNQENQNNQDNQEDQENQEKVQKIQKKSYLTINQLGGEFEDDAHRDRDPEIKKYDQWAENNQKFIFSIFYNVQEFLQKLMDMVFIMAKKTSIPDKLYQDINEIYQQVFQKFSNPQFFALKMFAGQQRANKVSGVGGVQDVKKNSLFQLQESKFTNMVKNNKIMQKKSKVEILSYFIDFISQDKMFKYFVNPQTIQQYWKKFEQISLSDISKDEFMFKLLKQIGQLRSIAFDSMAQKQIELFNHFLTVFQLIQKYSKEVYEAIKKQNQNFEVTIFQPLNIPKHQYIQTQYNQITERMMSQKVTLYDEKIELLEDFQSLQQNQEQNQLVEKQRQQIQNELDDIKYYDQKQQLEKMQQMKEEQEKMQVYHRLLEEKESKKVKVQQLNSIYGINKSLESLSIQQNIQDKDPGNRIFKLRYEVDEKIRRVKQDLNLLTYQTQNKFTNHYQASNESHIIRKHIIQEERSKNNNWKYPSQSIQFDQLPQCYIDNQKSEYYNNSIKNKNQIQRKTSHSHSKSQSNFRLPQTASTKSIRNKNIEYPQIDLNKETKRYAKTYSNKDNNLETHQKLILDAKKPKTSEGPRKQAKKQNKSHIQQLKQIIKQENYGIQNQNQNQSQNNQNSQNQFNNQNSIQNIEKSGKIKQQHKTQLILPRQVRPKTEENQNFSKKNKNFNNNNNNSINNNFTDDLKNSLHYKWIQQNQKSQQKNFNFQPVDLKSKNFISQQQQLLASENGHRTSSNNQVKNQQNNDNINGYFSNLNDDQDTQIYQSHSKKQNDFYINKYIPNQSSQADYQSTTYQDGTQSQQSLQTRKFGEHNKEQSQISNLNFAPIDEY